MAEGGWILYFATTTTHNVRSYPREICCVAVLLVYSLLEVCKQFAHSSLLFTMNSTHCYLSVGMDNIYEGATGTAHCKKAGNTLFALISQYRLLYHS